MFVLKLRFVFCFADLASSLTSTTPRSVGGVGRPGSNPLAPWLLNPSDSKSILGSGSNSTPLKGLILPPSETNSNNGDDGEDNMGGPQILLGNQSIYGLSGVGGGGLDLENPSLLVTTSSSTPIPISTSSAASAVSVSSSSGLTTTKRTSSAVLDSNSSSGEEEDGDGDVDESEGGRVAWPPKGGSEATESWWSSQFEAKGAGKGESDNMWSDKVAESESGGNSANSGVKEGKNGLGMAKGVVTLSPGIQPTQGSGGSSSSSGHHGHHEEDRDDGERDGNNRHGSSSSPGTLRTWSENGRLTTMMIYDYERMALLVRSGYWARILWISDGPWNVLELDACG
jgi:hypothetical protein